MSSQKSLAVAQYLLNRCSDTPDDSLTPMQLIKLVYVAHGYMLGALGVPLIQESVEAWQYGPVVPSVYRALKNFGSSSVSHVPGAPAHDFSFTDEEKKVMDFVASRYGRYDGITLSSATHRPGTPWDTAWAASGKNAVISNDVIESFYSQLVRTQAHRGL